MGITLEASAMWMLRKFTADLTDGGRGRSLGL